MQHRTSARGSWMPGCKPPANSPLRAGPRPLQVPHGNTANEPEYTVRLQQRHAGHGLHGSLGIHVGEDSKKSAARRSKHSSHRKQGGFQAFSSVAQRAWPPGERLELALCVRRLGIVGLWCGWLGLRSRAWTLRVSAFVSDILHTMKSH